MPRSRRRHHSRSRSRSRSHSHDRDREAKRRKIDSVESPPHKRSVSSTPQLEDNSNIEETINQKEEQIISDDNIMNVEDSTDQAGDETKDGKEESEEKKELIKTIVDDKLNLTPQKTLSPKQLQRKLESEKKKKQKQLEREEREKQKQLEREEREKQKQLEKEEKEKARLERERQKKEKEEKLLKERKLKDEQKRKAIEEKEHKRKEREERENQKKKEREQKQREREQQLEQKNKEKQKLEEQKQKAAAAFANFFVQKKSDSCDDKKFDQVNSKFMPFEVKSDMRLPPQRRSNLTDEEKEQLCNYLSTPNETASYLKDLKNGKPIGTCSKTWPFEEIIEEDEDDVVIVEDFGETISEEKPKITKMKRKFLKFHENRRPPYHGTWRKKSDLINSRKPLIKDTQYFDYEVDSDDDWEEEEQGESLNGSDDEEKENEVENDDFEQDDFLVPHGYLSDDEIDDEATAKLSPESQKQKLKLLQDQFEQDRKSKTHKLKPRYIGCIWYNKDGSNVEETIDRHLKPLAMITNGIIYIKKRNELNSANLSLKKGVSFRELKNDLMKPFLKLVHLNTNNQKSIVLEYINYLESKGIEKDLDVSKSNIKRNLKHFAKWKKCTEEGPLFNKYCWQVDEELLKQYSI